MLLRQRAEVHGQPAARAGRQADLHPPGPKWQTHWPQPPTGHPRNHPRHPEPAGGGLCCRNRRVANEACRTGSGTDELRETQLDLRFGGNFPLVHCPPGSMASTRLSIGGWVANKLDTPRPKNMWLDSAAFLCLTELPTPPNRRRALNPAGLRVNCTAEASARYSRCRDTIAFNKLPKNAPTPPTTTRASPGSTKARPPASSFFRAIAAE